MHYVCAIRHLMTMTLRPRLWWPNICSYSDCRDLYYMRVGLVYIIHQGDGYILCELCHKFALAPDYHRLLLGTLLFVGRQGMKPDIDIFLWPVHVEVEF